MREVQKRWIRNRVADGDKLRFEVQGPPRGNEAHLKSVGWSAAPGQICYAALEHVLSLPRPESFLTTLPVGTENSRSFLYLSARGGGRYVSCEVPTVTVAVRTLGLKTSQRGFRYGDEWQGDQLDSYCLNGRRFTQHLC